MKLTLQELSKGIIVQLKERLKTPEQQVDWELVTSFMQDCLYEKPPHLHNIIDGLKLIITQTKKHKNE